MGKTTNKSCKYFNKQAISGYKNSYISLFLYHYLSMYYILSLKKKLYVAKV